MDPAVVALLAAGIPAAVAAGAFTATQIISVVGAARRRRLDALVALLDALEAVPDRFRKPRILGAWLTPEITVMHKSMRLTAVLPKRERILWEWLAVRVQDLTASRSLESVAIASQISAMVMAFIRHPWQARRSLQRSRDRGDWEPMNWD